MTLLEMGKSVMQTYGFQYKNVHLENCHINRLLYHPVSYYPIGTVL